MPQKSAEYEGFGEGGQEVQILERPQKSEVYKGFDERRGLGSKDFGEAIQK